MNLEILMRKRVYTLLTSQERRQDAIDLSVKCT